MTQAWRLQQLDVCGSRATSKLWDHPQSLRLARWAGVLTIDAEFNWRREWDSNPRYGFRRTHAFQACALNHSAISPDALS